MTSPMNEILPVKLNRVLYNNEFRGNHSLDSADSFMYPSESSSADSLFETEPVPTPNLQLHRLPLHLKNETFLSPMVS